MMNKKALLVSITIVIALIGYKWVQENKTTGAVIPEKDVNKVEINSPNNQEEAIQQSATTNSTPIQESTNEVPQSSSTKAKLESGKGITVIGDSVVVGVAPVLEEQFPEIVVDGKVSRQMKQAQAVVDELKSEGKLGDVIVFELGTNGPFKSESLRSLLDSLFDKKVFLMNTRVPKDWQDSVNKTLSEVASEYSNTTVIDWYSASEGKKDYFYKDGVHLNPEGSKYYASVMMDAVNNYN